VRFAAFFAAGFVLLLLSTQLFRLTSLVHVPGLTPSLVLPLILFMGVHEYSLARGAGVAWLLGYATDLLGVAPVGLHTFTYVALFLLARGVGVRVAAQTTWIQIVLVLAFTLVHGVMLLMLLAIFGRDAWVPRALYPLLLPHVLATGAVAPLVFRLAQRLHQATTAKATATGGTPP
jgi:rod shape-determining protein MreD